MDATCAINKPFRAARDDDVVFEKVSARLKLILEIVSKDILFTLWRHAVKRRLDLAYQAVFNLACVCCPSRAEAEHVISTESGIAFATNAAVRAVVARTVTGIEEPTAGNRESCPDRVLPPGPTAPMEFGRLSFTHLMGIARTFPGMKACELTFGNTRCTSKSQTVRFVGRRRC